MSRTSIFVKHNAEIAHRLSKDTGKCLRIHGHSLQIELRIEGAVAQNGMLGGLNFTDIKRLFRDHIDGVYDHRLLLNQEDPILNPGHLPGLISCDDDPTIENIAKWIGLWCVECFKGPLINRIHIKVNETSTNGANWSNN
jgi:6-pyruvoyl-tetrahydropterin synthase